MPTLVLIVIFLISFVNQCFKFLKTLITNFDTLPNSGITNSDTRGMIFSHLDMFFSAKINKSRELPTLVYGYCFLMSVGIQ